MLLSSQKRRQSWRIGEYFGADKSNFCILKSHSDSPPMAKVCELMRRRILCSRLCGVLEFPQRARGSEEGVAWHPLQKIVYNKIRLFNDETQYIKKFILLILFWKCDILSMRTNTNIFWTYQTKGEVYPYRTIDLYMEKMQIPIDRCDVFVFIVFVRANRDLRFSCADLG